MIDRLTAVIAAIVINFCLIGCSDASKNEESVAQYDIRVTLLGTGLPTPNPRQLGPSVLVEAGDTKLLFDCGRGCAHRLWNLGPNYLRGASHLFLTHMHSDHTVGIADLYMNGWTQGRAENLHVYGSAAADTFMHHLRLAFEQDVVFRADRQHQIATREALDYEWVLMENGKSVTIGDATVTSFDVDHADIKPAFGYRIDVGERSVVISGDTTYSENLVRHSIGADVIIHEVFSPAIVRIVREMFPKNVADDIVSLHTLPPDVGRVFTETQTRLGVFTHLNNDPAGIPELIEQTRTTWDGALEVGEDLMVIEIGEEIRVINPSSD